MADVVLVTHAITSGLSGGGLYETGQFIRVIADGPAIRAELWTASNGGTFIATPSGGPDLTGEFNQIVVSSGEFNNFQYCDGEDLVYYTLQVNWPYAAYHLSENHPSCEIIVCDLEITGFTVTNETAIGSANGQIALTATSSNGVIKYSLIPDFNYVSQGLDSPLTGFNTGNYVVYAKDSSGCTDQINVFVGIDYTYGVRWRMEYDTVFPRGNTCRVDIEERDYVGAINETCGGEVPFRLQYNPSDESQVVPSEAVLELLIEQGEEGKFDDIRTGYDRQFAVKKYRDAGSGFVLEWVGYATPEFYQEPYLSDPYVITLKAIDGLGELKNKSFVQLSGEDYFGDYSVIQLVAECLKKLPISINIRSCVNIFEENMTTAATDDPLAQAFIKSQNYLGKKCEEVLTSLLKPFTRAELFQSFGVWWIRTKEQSVYSNLPYREFNKDGVFISDSSIAARKNLDFPSGSNRLKWTERTQLLQYSRNYGSFSITHNLGKDNNMIDSGNFEQTDIDPSTGFFRDWSLFPAQTSVAAGLELVDNNQSKGAFFFQWDRGGSNQADNVLMTVPMPLHITGNVFQEKSMFFKLKFQLYVAPTYPVKWIRVGWKLRMTDTDTGTFWDWHPPTGETFPVFPDDNEELINDIYIERFNSWETFEFYRFRLPGGVAAVNFTIQLSFYFHNHKGRDFITFGNLRAFDITTLIDANLRIREGKRFLVNRATAGTDEKPTYAYELQRNTEAESEPDIIRPTGYHIISAPYQWIKVAEYNTNDEFPLIDRIMIDNVKLSIFPIDNVGVGVNLVDPPETVVYEQIITDQNESSFDDEVDNGDAPPLVGKEYIYNGFFKLSDGTPTNLWARSGVTESRKLLSIYLNHLVAQGSQSLRILTGTGVADIPLGFINSLEDQIDNRRYRFKRFAVDDKRGEYDIEIEETLTDSEGEGPPDTPEFDSAYDPQEYAQEFN